MMLDGNEAAVLGGKITSSSLSGSARIINRLVPEGGCIAHKTQIGQTAHNRLDYANLLRH